MCDLHREDPEGEEIPARVADLIDGLVVCLTNGRIYPDGHPRVAESYRTLVQTIESVAEMQEERDLKIGCADGYVHFGGRPLVGATLTSRRLIDAVTRLESGGISLRRDCGEGDLEALVKVLGDRECATWMDGNKALARKGCRRIELLPPFAGLADENDPSRPSTDEMQTVTPAEELPRVLYQGVVDLLQEIMVKACRRDTFSIDEAKSHIEAVLKQLREDTPSMMHLSRYERYDAYTCGHSIRVCFLALQFGSSMTDDENVLHRLGTAALLHDVGKAWVPFEVLQAKGRLSLEERREMDKHTLHGAEILLGFDECDPASVAVALSHHQNEDGSGYPRTIHWPRPSLVTRIVKICDVYEALTASRPYKAPMSPARAYRIMLSMQEHFDARLLRRFIASNGLFPTGTRVRLDSGEIARVRGQTHSFTQPIVETEIGREGSPLVPKDRRLIDLSRPSAHKARPRALDLVNSPDLS